MKRLKKILKWTGIVLGALVAIGSDCQRLFRLDYRCTA